MISFIVDQITGFIPFGVSISDRKLSLTQSFRIDSQRPMQMITRGHCAIQPIGVEIEICSRYDIWPDTCKR